jgi:hypothetical protein
MVLFTVTVWALLLPLAVKQDHAVARAQRALRP